MLHDLSLINGAGCPFAMDQKDFLAIKNAAILNLFQCQKDYSSLLPSNTKHKLHTAEIKSVADQAKRQIHAYRLTLLRHLQTAQLTLAIAFKILAYPTGIIIVQSEQKNPSQLQELSASHQMQLLLQQHYENVYPKINKAATYDLSSELDLKKKQNLIEISDMLAFKFFFSLRFCNQPTSKLETSFKFSTQEQLDLFLEQYSESLDNKASLQLLRVLEGMNINNSKVSEELQFSKNKPLIDDDEENQLLIHDRSAAYDDDSIPNNDDPNQHDLEDTNHNNESSIEVHPPPPFSSSALPSTKQGKSFGILQSCSFIETVFALYLSCSYSMLLTRFESAIISFVFSGICLIFCAVFILNKIIYKRTTLNIRTSSVFEIVYLLSYAFNIIFQIFVLRYLDDSAHKQIKTDPLDHDNSNRVSNKIWLLALMSLSLVILIFKSLPRKHKNALQESDSILKAQAKILAEIRDNPAR